MKAILDTSVLIASDARELDGELAISAASLTELHFGVLVTTDPAIRAERLRRLAHLQLPLRVPAGNGAHGLWTC